jgi:hypothetical protein
MFEVQSSRLLIKLYLIKNKNTSSCILNSYLALAVLRLASWAVLRLMHFILCTYTAYARIQYSVYSIQHTRIRSIRIVTYVEPNRLEAHVGTVSGIVANASNGLGTAHTVPDVPRSVPWYAPSARI